MVALYACWTAWAALWIVASWWSARRRRRAGGRQNITYQLVSVAGMLALPTVTRPTRALFTHLWQLGSPAAWALAELTAATAFGRGQVTELPLI